MRSIPHGKSVPEGDDSAEAQYLKQGNICEANLNTCLERGVADGNLLVWKFRGRRSIAGAGQDSRNLETKSSEADIRGENRKDQASHSRRSGRAKDMAGGLNIRGSDAFGRTFRVGDDQDTDDFWQQVKTNLQAGRVRLVFVADSIPTELRRIVEFLNTQMDPAEVLAIEVKQFVGSGMKTLVPRVLGQTEAARRGKSPGTKVGKQWDELMFMAALAENKGDGARTVAEAAARGSLVQRS